MSKFVTLNDFANFVNRVIMASDSKRRKKIEFVVRWDENGNISKRYCVTTEENGEVAYLEDEFVLALEFYNAA